MHNTKRDEWMRKYIEFFLNITAYNLLYSN